MFKFIHCADLHLDSPLRGLSAREDAPTEQIRSATRRALENLVDLAVDERVDFVVIAGDVYDGDWTDYSTGLFFNACMGKLRPHKIPVYLIRGNHDAASAITRSLVLPPNVTEFSTDGPETYRIEELKVALHGQGFAQRDVRENLSVAYPEPLPGYFNIGVLHTAAEGQEGHESYAPCRVDDLVQKGYDYWALGHIHKRQVLHEAPYVVFPGNLQGRHIRETGDKGCTLVTVDGGTVNLQHRSLDVLRWYPCDVDLTGLSTDADLSNAVQTQIEALVEQNPGYPLALRVRLTGATPMHGWLLEEPEKYVSQVASAASTSMSGDLVWIEKVKFETRPVRDKDRRVDHGDALDALLTSVTAAMEDEGFLEEFLQDMKQIQNRMSGYVKSNDATRVESVDDIQALVQDARAILMTMLETGDAS